MTLKNLAVIPKLARPISRAIGKLSLKLGNKKPGLLTGLGLLVGGCTLVVIAVDTWKGKEMLQADVAAIREAKNATDPEAEDRLNEAWSRIFRDCAVVYWKGVLLSGASAFMILKAHGMMKQALIEVTTALAVTTESFRRYRENVIADQGIEADQKYAYGVEMVDWIDADTEEVSTRAIPARKMIPGASPYARWLDEGEFDQEIGNWIWRNHLYSDSRITFITNLQLIQNELNDILRRRGWLTLNEAYEKLGFPPTIEGQHVGWVRGGGKNGEVSDGFVDFRVFPDYMNGKYQLPVNKLFLDMNSNQRYPLLDFNVEPIDYIFDDIFEYDNNSYISFNKRRQLGQPGASEEYLERWFLQNEMNGE